MPGPESRRDYFVAESALRKIVSGFVKEQVRPHLDNGKSRLDDLDELVVEQDDPEQRAFYEGRVNHLKKWRRRANSILPFAVNFIKPD